MEARKQSKDAKVAKRQQSKDKSVKNVAKKGKENKVKKPKKDKDITIKRPKNAYMYFCAEQRSEVTAKFPDLKGKEILKKLGELWAEVTDKSKYEKLAEADKKRYQQEKEAEGVEQPKKVKKPKKGKENKGKKMKPKDDADDDPISISDEDE